MEPIPSLLDAIASLMWPLLVLVVLIKFAPAVEAIIESAKSRKFTLKVGGQELSMDEVREQQSALISDLQNQVAGIKAMLGEDAAPADEAGPATSGISGGLEERLTAAPTEGPARVLWVDDEPKNNGLLIDRLTSGGAEVDLALSTADALKKLDGGAYRAVASDLGRREEGRFNGDAGLQLLKAVKEMNPTMPFVLFTSSRGAKRRGAEAESAGADLVTSSATDLLRFFAAHLPEWGG